MSENTPVVESEVKAPAAEKAPKTAKAKKTVKAKKVSKAGKGKKAVTKAAKAEKAPRQRKEGLRKPQVRILKALAKANKPLSRAQIAEKAGVDVAGCVEWIGSYDDEVRLANDTKHFPSLITLGLVKAVDEDQDGRSVIVHSATAKGKAEAAKAE